jgi:DNA polymerase elongation subunit (family B)
MIFALDNETIPNKDMIPLLPEPDVKLGNLKDADKIKAKVAQAKVSQVDRMALDPMTGRVCCYAMVGEYDHADVMTTVGDVEEMRLIMDILTAISVRDAEISTWNGNGFDLPFIYKRAMILGIDLRAIHAPSLSYWTKRYRSEPHCDLMQVWANWSQSYTKLDTVARMVLGSQKNDIDVTKIADKLGSEEGRKEVMDYCIQDTQLTYDLFCRFDGFLY